MQLQVQLTQLSSRYLKKGTIQTNESTFIRDDRRGLINDNIKASYFVIIDNKMYTNPSVLHQTFWEYWVWSTIYKLFELKIFRCVDARRCLATDSSYSNIATKSLIFVLGEPTVL